MSDFEPSMPMVFRYGVLRTVKDADGQISPVQVPVWVRDQLRIVRQLRNEWVEIDRDYDRMVDDAWRTHPDVAQSATQVETALTAVDKTRDRIASERVEDRAAVTRPQSVIDLRAAEHALSGAWSALKQARAGVKTTIAKATRKKTPLDPATARVVALLAAAGTCRRQRLSTLYERYCQTGVMPRWCPSCDQRYQPDDATVCVHCGSDRQRMTLHWPSFNAARLDHRVAVQRVIERRMQGQSAELSFRRWDGTGVIAVQLQRMHGDCGCYRCVERAHEEEVAAAKREGREPAPKGQVDPTRPPRNPPRTPALLAGQTGKRSKWVNVFELSPWMPPEEHAALSWTARQIQGTARLNVGQGRIIELPVRIGRMMPADADVAEVQLSVSQREGPPRDPRLPVDWSMLRMSVCVTALVPQPVVSAGPRVAVHVGWRKRPDGAVRVGVWRSTTPLTLPDHALVGPAGRHTKRAPRVIAKPDGLAGEILLPASWLDRAGNPAGIRSHRDQLFIEVKAEVADWLDQQTTKPDGLTGETVRRWRSPRQLQRLARQWRDDPPPDSDQIVERLTSWAARDRHLHAYEANERDQLGRRRDDAWRRLASAVVGQAGQLLVDDTDLAQLRRRPGFADTDLALPPAAAGAARARANMSAPGILRSAFENAARSRGVPVSTVELAWWSRTCPRCHQVGDDPRLYAASAVVRCPHCGQEYDQDHTVARYMLDPPPGERPDPPTRKRGRSRRR